MTDTPSQSEHHAPAPPSVLPAAQDGFEDDLSIRLLPRQRVHVRFARFLRLAVLTQAIVTASILLALQGPWREDHRSDHGQALAELTASRLRDQRFLVRNPVVQNDLDDAAALPSVAFAVLVDDDGRILMSGGDAAPDLGTYRIPKGPHGSTEGAALRRVDIASNLVVFDCPMPDEQGRSRRLLMGVRDLGARRAVIDGGLALLAAMLITLLVSVPFAIVRFRSWTRGLHDLHAAIRRLALGAPLKPVAVGSDDEVAYLSIAFNDMAGRLNASRHELIMANQSLERRVADRTEELRVANEKLERQNVRLGDLSESALRFTDDVAHEFRTPLAVIMEFASIMADGIGGEVSEEQAGYLGFIAEASRDLAGMVDDFLDSGKLRARSLPVNRRIYTVDEIVDPIWPMLQTRAAHAKVELRRDIDPDAPEVYAESKMVGRAIVNLVINALKFSPEGTQVTIRIRPDGLGTRISVIDQGPGLGENEVDALFKRFKQTSTGRDSTSKGFGLGLSIVKELVTMNLGEVGVQSTPGKGSVFSFILPSSNLEAIMGMFLQRSRTKASGSKVGVIRLRRETDSALDEALVSFLTSVIQPLDLRLPLPDGQSHLLVGETGDLQAWCERLRRASVESRHMRGGDGGALVIERAVLCSIDEVRDVVLSEFADEQAERKVAA